MPRELYCTVLPAPTVLCYLCLVYCANCAYCTVLPVYCTVLPVPTVQCYLCPLYCVSCAYSTVLSVPLYCAICATVLCYLCLLYCAICASVLCYLCYCTVLSVQGEQKGQDSEGLHGFLPQSIEAEIARGKSLTCVYCASHGATVVCSFKSCRVRFHFPCGYNAGCLFLFMGQFQVPLPLWIFWLPLPLQGQYQVPLPLWI